jgi:hypothetical protein
MRQPPSGVQRSAMMADRLEDHVLSSVDRIVETVPKAI